jgi:hypothetical protein
MNDDHPAPIDGLVRIAVGVCLLMAFHATGLVFMQGWVLDLGSLHLPAPRHATFMAAWAVVGTAAAAMLGAGVALRAPPGALAAGLLEGSDRRFVAVGMLGAFAVAVGVNRLVLNGMPVTDDESSYLLAARLLAEGRLWMESPADKLFFDRAFLINDGRMYTQYFLGWPALLAPFAALGVPWLANPIYAALTLPAVHGVVRHVGGAGPARLAVLAFVTSPMMMIAASTGMSHTSITAALAWCTWAALRSREPDAPTWVHAAVGGAFGVAFFIRPLSAVGAGLPLLAYWAWGAWRLGGAARWRAAAAFALPAAALAGAFFAVNIAQNGSPTAVSYQRMVSYASENGFRFSHLRPDTDVKLAGFRWYGPIYSAATATIAAWRLSFSLLGWPLAVGFAALAGLGRGRGLLHASWISFFVFSFAQYESGVDAYAPVHYFEAGLPLLMLVPLGVWRVAEASSGWRPRWVGSLPVALALASMGLAVLGYWPVKLRALARMADDVGAPHAAVDGLDGAVVFAPRPFAEGCRSAPTRHWVFWRPDNPPELDGRILWVNHVDVERDRAFMARHPERRGYVLRWTEACEVEVVPLESADGIPAAEQVLAPVEAG